MTAELVRGQNHALPRTRLEIRVSAGGPVVAGATLGDEHGTVAGAEWVAHPGAPRLPGVEVLRQTSAGHRLAVDLDALPAAVHRVGVLLALLPGTGGPARFGELAAPSVAVTGVDGTEIARYTITGLDAEAAVVALELYRRQDAWKVRAVGQGYASGLPALLADQGLHQSHELAASIHTAAAGTGTPEAAGSPGPDGPPHAAAATGTIDYGHPARRSGPAATSAHDEHLLPHSPGPGDGPEPASVGGTGATTDGRISYAHPRRQASAPPPAAPDEPARPVAGDATGWSMEERLYNQVWGMFEDLARTAASYRSAVDFADLRMEQELDRVLSDPRSRIGSAGDQGREAARAKRDELVDRAREAFERDIAQLAAESEVVEPALPAAFARWDNPVWQAYQVPTEAPMALRIGDLHLPERTALRIPMLVRLPLERGLWIDAGRSGSDAAALMDAEQLHGLALETAAALAARLLAIHPPGAYTVRVIDPAGSAAVAFAQLTASGALSEPLATGAQGPGAVLEGLTRRVDLLQMAARGNAADALPPGLDPGEQLLIVNDFPHGFDDRTVNRLRYIADEGPSVGVHLMMVADREEAATYGPVLDPLWRSLLRLSPVPDDHLADPWVGHTWTYEPILPPRGSEVLGQVLGQVAGDRWPWG
ncbi:TerD family protein [Streptomyces sannanensis]|uniref:TerD family protein n=1 Tax=Streptomyces sannanensis TaxID=285536 RepID=A0ABP6S7M9_9ACTN